MNKHASLEKIVAWAKRRGFMYQTSDIYGGMANNYDYGPYGALLKNNVRDHWWKKFMRSREDIVALDGAILMQRNVWEASGHTESFNEALVEDLKTNKRYRADHLAEDWCEANNNDTNIEKLDQAGLTAFLKDNDIKSPDGNPISEPKYFNQMFATNLNLDEREKDIAYLRPETAGSIFVNFKNVTDSMRVKVPFGIAQVGKMFRKEITKGQFIFRTIESEQMEIEYFIDPEADWENIMKEWLDLMKEFYIEIGAAPEDVRFRQHTEEELSHYSKRTYDPEYDFDFGWKEIAGLAHRQDYDLTQHQTHSKQKLQYRDPYQNKTYVPHVIEPSFGLARAVLVAMYAAYTEEDLGDGKTRTVMKFPRHIAPIKAAIFPLQKNPELQAIAKGVFDDLKMDFDCEYDNAGNIGKMYRRQDEIGTPFCIVADFDTIKDKAVTVRDRDTMEQERVKIADLKQYLQEQI